MNPKRVAAIAAKEIIQIHDGGPVEIQAIVDASDDNTANLAVGYDRVCCKATPRTCRWNGGKGVDFHDSLYRSPQKGVGFAILAPQMLAMALLGVPLTLSVFRFHKALD